MASRSNPADAGLDRRRFLLAQASAAAFTVGVAAYSGPGWAGTSGLGIEERVARLETAAGRVEDVRAVKRLKRAYSSYLEFGLWKDLIELFTEDAIGDYPAGVFQGRKMLWPHFIDNNGRGVLGVENGRLMPHISFQPVVTLSADGKTAHARWKVFAMLGSLAGKGMASWNGMLYEDTYVKQDGVWKIKDLRTHSEWGGSYDTGWTNVRAPAPRAPGAPVVNRFARLPQPPLRAHNEACEGYLRPCTFAYSFPSGAVGRPIPNLLKTDDDAQAPGTGDLGARFAAVMQRIDRLNDEVAVIDLNNAYGHHTDAKEWDKVAALFADDGTFELGQQGVYVGPAHIRKALEIDGPKGLSEGEVFDHMDFGPLVTIGPDGKTAKSHSVVLIFIGKDGKGEVQQGIYENSFVKTAAGWKISSVHFYPRFIADAAKGWGKDAEQPRKASASIPPDRPPSETYEIYPKGYFTPLHYVNPVSGKPAQYPAGAPAQGFDAQVIAFSAKPAPPPPVPVAKARAGVTAAESQLEKAAAFDAAENLISAYGYYTDHADVTGLDDLFAPGASIKLAGEASGPGKVGAFLRARYGETGMAPGHMLNHLVFQPVVTVAPDARSATIHARLFEQTGVAQGAATWAAGLYDDRIVLEDGTWKFQSVGLVRTWSAPFKDTWIKAVVADNGGTRLGPGRVRTRTKAE